MSGCGCGWGLDGYGYVPPSLSLAHLSHNPSSKLPNLPTCQPAPLSILPPPSSFSHPTQRRTHTLGLRGACPEATNPSCPSTDSSHPSVNIQRANIIHTPHHSHSYLEAATSAHSSQPPSSPLSSSYIIADLLRLVPRLPYICHTSRTLLIITRRVIRRDPSPTPLF